ncbi:MAG: hypothetical protein H8E80_00955 [Desulfobacteraceae bacterium]|uniref:Uncharacterized protein n=1 Tax=Candidatus Desulfaltia bathyphila TaxID=2841697 RepID=A0A8J6N307_9BACT|nr:hypothetical protein [Candidatus Desulfaltia bathyphila]
MLAKDLHNIQNRQVKKQITARKVKISNNYSILFILSILNTKLSNWVFQVLMSNGLDIYPSHVRRMPIPKMSGNSSQKPFIDIVDRILAVTKSEDYLESPEKQAKVKALEAEIDQLVYKLYGLTPEEIKIVEGENANAD